MPVISKWLKSGEKGNWHKPTRFPYFGTQPRHMPYHLGTQRQPGTRSTAPSPIPCLLPLPCLSRAVLSCPAPACRETHTETGRLSRHAAHLSIDRSQSTHGRPCFQEPSRPAGCDLPALHLPRAHRADRSRETNPSSLQPTPTTQSPQPPSPIPLPAGRPRPPWLETYPGTE